MKESVMKLQIESLEQQLKVLKLKILTHKKGKFLSDLYGAYEGKMDISLEEIKKYEYSFLVTAYPVDKIKEGEIVWTK